MYEHPVHGIWFASASANVYATRNDSAFMVRGFEKISRELSAGSNEISDMLVDDSLNIWIFTKGKSYKLIKSKGYQGLQLDSLYMGSSRSAALLRVDSSYYPLVANYDCPGKDCPITAIDAYTGKRIDHETKEQDTHKPRIALEIDGTLYINKGSSLLALKNKTSTPLFTADNLILFLTSDRDNNLWAGCYNDGLYKIDSTGKVLEHYFEGTTINCILFDDQEGMWVSTTGKGLFHCRNIHNAAYRNIPGLDKPITFLKAIGSSLIVCNAENSLYRLPEKIAAYGLVNEVTDILQQDNDYLVSAKTGIYKVSADLAHSELVKCSAPSYALAQAGDDVYYIQRTGIGIVESCKHTLAVPAKVNHFICNAKNEFLIATDNGLYEMKNNVVGPSPYHELEEATVTRLVRAPDGSIWACTRGNGLYKLEKGKAIYIPVPSRIVNDVCFLSGSLIAAACNNGTYINLTRNAGKNELWLSLDGQEALRADALNDVLYIGTAEGLFSYDTRQALNEGRAAFYLSGIKAGEQSFSSAALVFHYSQHSPEFLFEYLDHSTRDRRLSYTLEGPVSRSDIIDGMRLRLYDLPAGTYTLTASPHICLTGERNNIAINFTIEAPYWQHWWFITLLIIGGAALLAGTGFFFYTRIKRRAQKKAELSRLLAEYKLTALKAQINPHFMSNALSAIQLLILTNETDKAGQYLAKFSLFIRKVLQYSDRSIIPLSEELKMIDLYIELEMLRFNDAFEYHKMIDPALDMDETFVPPLITQPFVENAVWHGLLPLKDRKPRLLISVKREGEELKIIIEDNGIGQESYHNTEAKKHESKGTNLTRSRLEHVNLLLGVSSARLDIDYLSNNTGNSEGTRVSIALPANTI
jgi:hypothetical protein